MKRVKVVKAEAEGSAPNPTRPTLHRAHLINALGILLNVLYPPATACCSAS
jgi:hypothetical protein